MADDNDVDPECLRRLKAEWEKIPPQAGPRAENARQQLGDAIERLAAQQRKEAGNGA
jgi:hypothetical protein